MTERRFAGYYDYYLGYLTREGEFGRILQWSRRLQKKQPWNVMMDPKYDELGPSFPSSTTV